MIEFVPKHASHSAINSFMRCGKAFELERIRKFPQAPAWFLIAGKAVHKATEWWDNGDFATETPSQLFLRAFHEEIDREKLAWPDQDSWRTPGWGAKNQRYEHWSVKGQDYVEMWAQTAFPGTLVGRELDLTTVLPSGLVVKAYADVVFNTAFGEYLIWDLKTGSKRPDSDQQLGIYTALYKHHNPKAKVVKAATFMFKDWEAYEMEVDHWTLHTVDEIGQQWMKAVKAGVFLPNRGSFCTGCGVSEACYLQSGDTPVTRLYDVLNPNYEGV